MAIDEHVAEVATRHRVPTDIPTAPRIRSRRNPRWIALGVIAVCLGALASFFLYSQLAESHQVVAVRHTISRGSSIGSDDLGAITVSDTGGVRTVPAAELTSLIGRVAAYDLVAGSLLPPDAVTDRFPPDHGRSVVGIRVDSGRAPTGFLTPGSPIRLVVLPADAAGGDAGGSIDTAGGQSTEGGAAGTRTIGATVVGSQELDDGVFLNVELDSDQAVDAASYSALGRVAVIRESER
jgi:hypothetical protein